MSKTVRGLLVLCLFLSIGVLGILVQDLLGKEGEPLPDSTGSTGGETIIFPDILVESAPENQGEAGLEEEISQEIPEVPSLRLNYLQEQSIFELPLVGASAYASIPFVLRAEAKSSSEGLADIPSGEGFVICEDVGDWWLVEYHGIQGYVVANHCLLNLPDVLPSAVYLNTNATASAFHASFVPLPEITGESLYEAYDYNHRLGKEEFVSVVLYQTAIKIAMAQGNALANGDTLIINETYRPAEVQSLIVQGLSDLSRNNATVREGITKSPWNISWFINTGVSNHQKGIAIDASLGKILAVEEFVTGDYIYHMVTEYEEYPMPTPIHELSYRSASMDYITTVIEAEAPIATDTLSAVASDEVYLSGDSEEQGTWEEVVGEGWVDDFGEGWVDDFQWIEDEDTTQNSEDSAPNNEDTTQNNEDTAQNNEDIAQNNEDSAQDSTEGASEENTEGIAEENREDTLMEEGEAPLTISSWERAETMTEGADRLQRYFRLAGMTSIQSEWWHFNDFNAKGSSANVGKYYIIGVYSQAPWYT